MSMYQLNWREVEKLNGSDFLFMVSRPIFEKINEDEEIINQLSENQKALYYFWLLDDKIIHEGFIHFYWEGLDINYPGIINSLQQLNHQDMLDFIGKAHQIFLDNENRFNELHQLGDIYKLNNELGIFNSLDNEYVSIPNRYESMENFVRKNIKEFM